MSGRLALAALMAAGMAGGVALGLTAGAYAQAQHTVHMAGSAYGPATVQARRGDLIRFVNDDTETHVVYVPTFGFGIDFGTQRPGQTVELRLQKPGAFRVECVLHPEMVTNVNVAQ